MNKHGFNAQKFFFAVFALAFFFLSATSSYALPFNIAPKAGTQLPTTASVSGVPAYYTVFNNTQSPRNTNYIKYLPPNVSQVTSGGTFGDTCGAVFNLAAKGKTGDSCTLQLTVSGPVNAKDPNPHHHLFACFPGGVTCAGPTHPLNVMQIPQKVLVSLAITPPSANILARALQQFTATGTYSDGSTTNLTSSVTWHSSSTAATISSAGLAKGVTTGSVAITAELGPVTSNGAALAVTAYAYITNNSGGVVSSCLINNDGTFGTCNANDAGFAFPNGIKINPAGSFVYIVGSGVTFCPINTAGTLGICNDTTGTGFLTPWDIAINPAGTLAYVTNITNGIVSLCTINANGTFGTCTTAGSGFSTPEGIAINPAGTFAYIVNFGFTGTVSYCAINPNGTFGTCNNTNGNGFSFPQWIAINPAGTVAYVSNNGNGSVSACPINPNGTFGFCQTTGSGFSNPWGIAINSADTFTYIANFNTGTVSYCTMNNDGSFNICNITGSGFTDPEGIAVL